jgi:acyl-CoA synthetase (AMP-forming)/AMP-acid ligase II
VQQPGRQVDGPAVAADVAFGTIPRMVRASADRFGERDAVVDGALRWSFRDVEHEMQRVAAALLADGVTPGDRVALWAPNSAAWITTALGILATGAWLVPINTRFRGGEAAAILAHTDARLLFATDDFLGTDHLAGLRGVAPDLRAARNAVLVPGPGRATTDPWDEFLARGTAVTADTVEAAIAAGAADDVSDVVFTSGTTGTPKGVMLRHGASLRGYEIFAARFGLRAGDRYLVPTPFFHCFGYKAGWMIGLMTGATTYPVAAFDPDLVLRTIQAAAITHFPGPPTMFSAILDHPHRDEHDLSSLRNAIIGAASIPEPLVHRMRDELGIGSILSAYGLTENHALVSLTDPQSPPAEVATTVGRPIPGVELRIVDQEGAEVPAGDEGEVLVRSPYLMSGYYRDPEATANVVVDGWLHTGDVGRVDERGLLHITDRLKDLFIVGGFNVAPAEVEHVLLGCAGVAQVAVVGVPDDYFGEVGAAFVVPADPTLTADAVLAHAREHLANFKVPRRVELVGELPVNATGKVRKDELRARAAERP